MIDIRISQVRDIVECVVGKKRETLESTYCLLTNTNELIIIQDNTLIYTTKLRDVPEGISLCNIGFRYSDIMDYENRDEYIHSDEFANFVYNTVFPYTNAINNCRLIYQNDNLKDNPKFAELLALKSAQGMKFFNIVDPLTGMTHFIPMFSTMMKIAKNDSVGIKLYDLDSMHLLVSFNMYKKRINNSVNMIFKILKLS